MTGSGNSGNTPAALAVSPERSIVFVTGTSDGGTKQFRFSYGYDTVAYNAATGAQRWRRVYEGPIIGAAHQIFFAEATSLAVSPDGSAVFVTGTSQSRATGQDYATIAYGAATGAPLWVRRYTGPGAGNDRATAIAVAPRGGTVFVTGRSMDTSGSFDFATLAYGAATGRQLWARRFASQSGDAVGVSLGLAPSGRTVFVAGSGGGSSGVTRRNAFIVAAYRAAAGARLWVSRHNAPAYRSYTAAGIAVGPSGRRVYVTGTAWGARLGLRDYATVAFAAATARGPGSRPTTGQRAARTSRPRSPPIPPPTRSSSPAPAGATARTSTTRPSRTAASSPRRGCAH